YSSLHSPLRLFSSFIFFFPSPPPPCSTLFPYTTLFRSLLVGIVLSMGFLEAAKRISRRHRGKLRIVACLIVVTFAVVSVAKLPRSEEHTSELQSRFDLVCRLLLEKKKYKDPSKQTSLLL